MNFCRQWVGNFNFLLKIPCFDEYINTSASINIFDLSLPSLSIGICDYSSTSLIVIWLVSTTVSFIGVSNYDSYRVTNSKRLSSLPKMKLSSDT